MGHEQIVQLKRRPTISQISATGRFGATLKRRGTLQSSTAADIFKISSFGGDCSEKSPQFALKLVSANTHIQIDGPSQNLSADRWLVFLPSAAKPLYIAQGVLGSQSLEGQPPQRTRFPAWITGYYVFQGNQGASNLLLRRRFLVCNYSHVLTYEANVYYQSCRDGYHNFCSEYDWQNFLGRLYHCTLCCCQLYKPDD